MVAIKHSPGDTRHLGLRVGHAAGELVSPDKLADAVLDGAYDLCRLKVPAVPGGDGGVGVLEAAGFPCFFGGGLLLYRRDWRQRPYTPRYPPVPGLAFHDAGPHDAARLAGLLRECFRDDPIGYHKTPWLRALFSRDAEVECLVSHYLESEVPGRRRVLVTRGGEDVGFIVMTDYAGTLHTDLLGIRTGQRGRGLFGAMRDFIHLYASDAGLCEEEGARYDNVQSQELFRDDGLEHVANEVVWHLVPLLSRGAAEPRAVEADPARPEAALEAALGAMVDLGGLRRTAVRTRSGAAPGAASGRILLLRVAVHTPELVVAVASTPAGAGAATVHWLEYRRSAAS